MIETYAATLPVVAASVKLGSYLRPRDDVFCCTRTRQGVTLSGERLVQTSLNKRQDGLEQLFLPYKPRCWFTKACECCGQPSKWPPVMLRRTRAGGAKQQYNCTTRPSTSSTRLL